jgi:hypothetical protein
VSANIVNTLGYFIFPMFWNLGIDEWQRDAMKALGCLFLDERVIIEHMSAVNGKAEIDENHKWVYSAEQEFTNVIAQFEWRQIADEELARIRKARGY